VGVGELGKAWTQAVAALGGDSALAQSAAVDAERRYGAPTRGYHGTAHVLSVLRDIADLAPYVGLNAWDHACVEAAACAHDVVYEAVPDQDERRSAAWARTALLAAGVGPLAADRVHGLVLATSSHEAPDGDDAAAVLLDADLAILGSPPTRYAAYVAAVRAEYHQLDDAQWASGRTAVLRSLVQRRILFHTARGRGRWELPARANMAVELAGLAHSVPDPATGD
jgi:predicted metal-dependent HD superfamily phosphohydrolase